jgi:hypothetical protein
MSMRDVIMKNEINKLKGNGVYRSMLRMLNLPRVTSIVKVQGA